MKSDMIYIEFDESEHLYSDFTDKSLNLIADLMGPEVRDKLLFPVVENVRFFSGSHKHAV